MKSLTLVLMTVLFSTSALASPNARTISGKIVSLNPEAKTVSIMSEEQRSFTYRYIDGIRVKNKPTHRDDMADLRVGEEVVLTLESAAN